MTRTRTTHLWALVALILLAGATRLYHIQAQSVWFDEGWSAFAAVQPTLADAIAADPTNPPLYYTLLNLFARGAGDSEFSLRLFSLLAGLLTIPLVYQLGRRLFSARAGLYGALLAALSPPLWWASQEARMYTLLAALVLVCALAFHALLERPSRRAWLALLAAELALLYAHNTGPVIVLWLNAAALLAWLARRRADRPPWRAWVAGQIAVGLLWLPWFALRFVELQTANSAVASAPQLGLALLAQIWQAFWVSPWGMVGGEPVLIAFALAAFVLWLALTPWREASARWLAVHVALLTGFLLLGLVALGNELHGRYLVMVVPLLLTLVGAGLARVPLTGPRVFLAGVFAALLAANVALAQNPAYQHDDARALVQHYAATLTAADTVLAWSYADRYELWYYWGRLDAAARRVTLPEGADLDEIAPLLPLSGDVALNVWYTQRADYRGMMGCLLGAASVALPDVTPFYGMTSARYALPALALPELRPFDALALADGAPVARVTAVGAIAAATAERGLCLPVTLEMLADVDADFKAALTVYNALGWPVAQADAVFATANQRTSSQLAPGETLTAYALLRLPVGAPPGVYDVRLRLYDETRHLSGYDLQGVDGLARRDLPVGEWEAVPGADWARTRRETNLPYAAAPPVAWDGLRLAAHDLPPQPPTLAKGATLRLSLLWEGDGPLPDLTLAGDGWQVTAPAADGPRDPLTLDWREVRVPADAAPGPAALRLPDGAVIGRFIVENVPGLFDPPPFAVAVDQALPGVGKLAGFTLAADSFDRAAPLAVTLVWQADGPTDAPYTVFVQLLDASGALIAQSDAEPAGGSRPTTGWRSGEYIVDAHALTFNARAAPGPAALIAGMYNAPSGQRVSAADGRDFIALPGTVTVR